MATGGRREEIDAKLKDWERELEKLRLMLARAPDEEAARHRETFIELYRKKESARSHWEGVRGVYLPDSESVRQVEKALAEVEAAWSAAQPMFAEVCGPPKA